MEFDHIVAIQNDALRLTQHGLAVAIGHIPTPIKRAFKGQVAYSWAGEATDEQGKRWCLVRMTIRPEWNKDHE